MAISQVFSTMPARERGPTDWCLCQIERRELMVLFRSDSDQERHIKACVSARLGGIPAHRVRLMASGRIESEL